MGTYPDLPSYILDTGEDLQKLIDKEPLRFFGQAVLDKYGHSNLPFLPKVLSIAKALPLQLHPNKEMAAKLHKEDPSNFTDPNHKPEIALALGDFEAFCGFKPLQDIHSLLQLSPLKQFLHSTNAQFNNTDLREVVRKMLTADDATIKTAVEELEKLDTKDFGKANHIPKLIPRLASQYDKTDPGILVALITMNFLELKAGDCISIPADGIHAYLSGDIIECMARSNNVLNTGFCPKAERNSVDLFCKCLTFSPHSAEECMLQPEVYSGCTEGNTKIFRPPMNEFNLLAMELQKGGSEAISAIGGPAIAIATKGSAQMHAGENVYNVEEGSIWFIGNGTAISLKSQSGLKFYIAYADSTT